MTQKNRTLIGTIVAISILLLPVYTYGEQIFLHGAVKWDTNSPAVGFRVELVKYTGGRLTHVAATETNLRGNYVFYDIQGLPKDYTLRIVKGEVLKLELPIGLYMRHNRIDSLPSGSRIDLVIE